MAGGALGKEYVARCRSCATRFWKERLDDSRQLLNRAGRSADTRHLHLNSFTQTRVLGRVVVVHARYFSAYGQADLGRFVECKHLSRVALDHALRTAGSVRLFVVIVVSVVFGRSDNKGTLRALRVCDLTNA